MPLGLLPSVILRKISLGFSNVTPFPQASLSLSNVALPIGVQKSKNASSVPQTSERLPATSLLMSTAVSAAMVQAAAKPT